MIELKGLIIAYRVARKNKRRSPDQVEFELHWEARLYVLYQDILYRQVRPTAYTFITDYPRPREVFACDMGMRVLHHFLDIRLRPLLEARLSPHTYNNRRKMGQNAMQNAVIGDIYKVSKGFTRDCWLLKVDMSGCFPNIRQDVAFRQLEEVVRNDYFEEDKDDVLYILRLSVYSYPTLHCYRKSPLEKWELIPKEKSIFNKPLGIGAAIGHLLWQNAVNYYFHDIDEWLMSLADKFDGNFAFERFVDDIPMAIADKTTMLPYLMPALRAKLGALGARLNERKFYCQHYTKGIECVGVHIKMDRVYINRRVVKRGIMKARSFSRCVRVGKIHTLLSSINSYLGMCKNLNGYNQAMRIIAALDKRWWDYVEFNRDRVCLQAKPEYTQRNRIINIFNLSKHDTRRKNTATSAFKRTA